MPTPKVPNYDNNRRFHANFDAGVKQSQFPVARTMGSALRSPLAELDCGQGQGGEGGGHQPEAHDYLRLAPAGEVEMVVQWGAAK